MNHQIVSYDLIVLSHGIDSPFGCAEDMSEIERHLQRVQQVHQQQHAGSRPLMVLNSITNVGRTQDGILCLGRRLLEEIQAYVARHFPISFQPQTIYLSFIGHSLGGLIARSCIGWMQKRGLFQSRAFVPVSFISVATPHLGARRAALHHALLKQIVQFYWFGPTLYELFLEDHLSDPGSSSLWSPLVLGQRIVRTVGPPSATEDLQLLAELRQGRNLPLLWLLAEPHSVFFLGLHKFSHLTLISAVKFDWQVPYCSSSLTSINPHCSEPVSPLTNRITSMMGFDAELTRRILVVAHPDLHPTVLKPFPPKPAEIVPVTHFSLEDLVSSHDFPLHDGLYHPTMLHHLQQLPWKRLDIAFDKIFSHDLLVAKPSIPFYDTTLGYTSSAIFGEIVRYEHELRHLHQTDHHPVFLAHL